MPIRRFPGLELIPARYGIDFVRQSGIQMSSKSRLIIGGFQWTLVDTFHSKSLSINDYFYPSSLPSHGRGRRFEPCTAHQNKPRKSLTCEAFLFSSLVVVHWEIGESPKSLLKVLRV